MSMFPAAPVLAAPLRTEMSPLGPVALCPVVRLTLPVVAEADWEDRVSEPDRPEVEAPLEREVTPPVAASAEPPRTDTWPPAASPNNAEPPATDTAPPVAMPPAEAPATRLTEPTVSPVLPPTSIERDPPEPWAPSLLAITTSPPVAPLPDWIDSFPPTPAESPADSCTADPFIAVLDPGFTTTSPAAPSLESPVERDTSPEESADTPVRTLTGPDSAATVIPT